MRRKLDLAGRRREGEEAPFSVQVTGGRGSQVRLPPGRACLVSWRCWKCAKESGTIAFVVGHGNGHMVPVFSPIFLARPSYCFSHADTRSDRIVKGAALSLLLRQSSGKNRRRVVETRDGNCLVVLTRGKRSWEAAPSPRPGRRRRWRTHGRGAPC